MSVIPLRVERKLPLSFNLNGAGQDQITVENSFDNVSGVATVDDNIGIAGVNLSTNQSIPGIGEQAAMAASSEGVTSVSDGEVIDDLATSRHAPDANVTVRRGSRRTVRINTTTSQSDRVRYHRLDTGTVAISPGGGPDTVVARVTAAVHRITLAGQITLRMTTKTRKNN